jgi:protein ImuB
VPRDPAGARILAIHVPDLPLQHARRGREAGADENRPVAVVSEGRVLHRDAAARAAGVRPGATAAEALAACGRLAIVPLDPAAERGALRALAEAMLSLVPAVEIGAPDVLLLDAGAAHLLVGGGESARVGEEALARRALAVAADMGYVARGAVASGKGPARALARRGAQELVVVPPGEEAGALEGLPLDALGLPPDVATRLAGLGIGDAGALARLPAGTLAHRFGPAGVLAARLARGQDGSPLVPYVPQTLPEEALDLDAPAEAADPLLFGLKRLAERVAARLAGRGLGATRLRIVLKLDPRGEERIAAALASPTASPARWLLSVKEHLFALRLPGAVTGLRLAAVEVAPVLPEQLAIGDRPEALAALEGVLARLAARLGEGALFAAELVERYRPEGTYRAVPFRPEQPRSGARTRVAVAAAAGPSPASPRPTRLLGTPAALLAESEGGRLTALRLDGRARSVLAMEGPERLRGEWWAAPFDRDYYRVRLDGLGDCWIFRDGGDGRLYLHGFFD